MNTEGHNLGRLDFSQRGHSCLRTPPSDVCHRPGRGYSCGNWQNRGSGNILVRRGSSQLTMATLMLYHNHPISVHAGVSIYLVHVFGAQLGASCSYAGFGWVVGSAPGVSPPLQEQQANQGMFISCRQKK